jgi:hypothetical protein
MDNITNHPDYTDKTITLMIKNNLKISNYERNYILKYYKNKQIIRRYMDKLIFDYWQLVVKLPSHLKRLIGKTIINYI